MPQLRRIARDVLVNLAGIVVFLGPFVLLVGVLPLWILSTLPDPPARACEPAPLILPPPAVSRPLPHDPGERVRI